MKKLNPVPTIFDPGESSNLSAEANHLKSPLSVPRKSPMKRVYQEDQLHVFEEQDKIKRFDDIDSKLAPLGYTFQRYDDHVVFYRLQTNDLNVPEVTDYESIETSMLSCSTRVHLHRYHSGSITEGTVVSREKV